MWRRSQPAAYRRLTFVPTILAQPVIETILTHLGLQASAPALVPAQIPLQAA
jgi:hypothetical protein